MQQLKLIEVTTPVEVDGEIIEVKTPLAPAFKLVHEFVRELTIDDLEALEAARTGRGQRVTSIKTLRTRHHEIARYMSLGMSSTQIAAIFNMSTSTLSLLKHNPAFQDLLAYYQSKRDEQFEAIGGRLHSIALDAVDRLDEMVNHPDAAPDFVLSAAKTVLDRIGHGAEAKLKLSGGVNINAIKSSYNPDSVRERPILDITPEGEAGSQPSVGQTLSPSEVGQDLPPAGRPGEGEGV